MCVVHSRMTLQPSTIKQEDFIMTIINVAELTSKIKRQGEKNAEAKELEFKSFVSDVIQSINHINNGLKDDAIALVEIFKALKENGMDAFGKGFYNAKGYRREFHADGFSHNLGFRECGENNICLMVLGGGALLNTGVCFLWGNGDLEITNECGEGKGITALELFSKLKNDEKSDSVCWIAKEVKTFEEQFIEFRDAYVAYANSLLN